MILILSLGKVLPELLVADGTLAVTLTLIHVTVDVLLDLQLGLGGELHLTEGTLRTLGPDLWLGKTVWCRGSGAQLGDGGGGVGGGEGGGGGGGGGVNVLRQQGGRQWSAGWGEGLEQ